MTERETGYLPSVPAVRLAEKLYMAFHRKMGPAKIPAFDAEAPNNAGWLHVAEIAIANQPKVDVKHDDDGVHVTVGGEVFWEWCPGPLERTATQEQVDEENEALAIGDVLADLDDGIAAAIEAKNFGAVQELIAMKASLYGLR